MAMVEIVNRVNQRVMDLMTASGYASLIPDFVFGPHATQEKGSPKRITWNFLAEKFKANSLVDARFPRSIKTRVMSFEIVVWGPTVQVSPVSQIGSTLGSCIVAGQPIGADLNPANYGVALQIQVAGAVGVSTFVFSLDSGLTWTTVPQTTGATVALGSSGLTATFTGNFQVNDQFSCVASDYEASDFATTEWMLHVLVNAIHAELFGVYEIMGGEWLNQGSADVVQDGKAYKLTVDVDVPVRELRSPAVAKALVTSNQETAIIGASVIQF